MIKQCRKLLAIQLLRSFGINEVLNTKDTKKKAKFILMGFCFLLVGLSFVFYIGITAYSLCYIGAAEIIPAYMLAITSILIMFFTILKTNGYIFQNKNYEMLVAMPIKPAVIVASRFLNMYISNLVASILVMVPSCFVYGIYAKTSVTFYIMTVISIFALPLIPMTIATTIGAIIAAISSRMKYKNLFVIVLSLVATMGIIVLSFGSGNMKTTDLANIAQLLTERVNEMYPLAPLYTSAVIKGNWFSFLLFVLLSILVFILFVAVVARKFIAISSALNSQLTKSNYEIKELSQNSPLKALYYKELKRYFSSNIYVLNTSIGYLMMIALSIAILVMGVENLEKELELSGIISKAIPLLLSAMCTITTTTISSISLEGKQWWIPKSLPVSTKAIFDSKLLVNLTLAIPCLIISVILIAIAVPLDIMGYVWLVCTPLVYNLFVAVMGITLNAKMPVFNWDNEAVVVKQSAAVFVGMLIGMASVIVPLILVFVLGNVSTNLITGVVTVVLAVITFLLYQMNNKMDLRHID